MRTSGFERSAFALALLAVGGLAAGGAGGEPIRFGFPSQFSGAAPVRRTAVGDFGGDGLRDVLGLSGSSLTLWRNLGGRQFTQVATVNSARTLTNVAAGDLDGDGRADAAIACATSPDSGITVHFGAASGFDPALVIPGDSTGVATVALADLDGDLDLDLVAGNPLTRRLLWALNLGGRTFGPLQATNAGVAAGRLVMADLQGDGHPDAYLAWDWDTYSAYPGDSLVILPGTAGGGFGPPIRTGIAVAFGVVDMDGDGVPDVISGDRCRLHLGHADGTFETAVDLVGAPDLNHTEPWGIALDLDRDRRLDWLQQSVRGSTTSWALELIQRDNLTFRLIGRLPPSGLYSAATGDLDGDGWEDLACGYFDRTGILIRWNEGGYLGNPGALFGNTMIYGPWDIEAGDVTGDGRADLVVSGDMSWGGIFASLGGGAFDETQTCCGSDGRDVELADFNGDGILDISTDHNSGYFWNDGRYSQTAGYYGGGYTFRYDDGPPYSFGFGTGDLDGDGDQDVMFADGHMLENDGTGHMSPLYVPWPRDRALVDVNGDGPVDFVGASADSIEIEINLGLAVPPFPIRCWAGGAVARWAYGDVDGDARRDFVIATTDGRLSVLLHLPGGGFGGPVLSAPLTAGAATELLLGRFDGDSKLDVVLAGSILALGGETGIQTLRSLGGGTLGEPWQTEASVGFPVAADLDGDGLDDLAWHGPGYPSGYQPVYFTRNLAQGPPTPVLVSNVEANAFRDRVRLAWSLGGDATPVVAVERAEAADAWREVARVAPDGSRLVRHEDRDVLPGGRYGYRLRVRDGGAERFLGEVWVAVPDRAAFALERVWPNPSRDGRLRVRLAVDRAEPVTLELLDVAGRIVSRRVLAAGEPGVREFAWNGAAGEPSRLRAGLYWVRASQGARSVASRFALVP